MDVVELLLEAEADPDVQNEVVHTIVTLTWIISMVNVVTLITTFFIFVLI